MCYSIYVYQWEVTMKKIYIISSLLLIPYTCYGMDLEQALNEKLKTSQISWEDVIRNTQQETNKNSHIIDVESAYGGGDIYNAKTVCDAAFRGDSVAQYSLYRHIKHNDFIAYMLLAISAIFGKFNDSIEEMSSIGLNNVKEVSPNTLEKKIASFTGR